jgi:flavin reductase (DIM6/NTAB) family NADH-FMN oxidoreductase RutF
MKVTVPLDKCTRLVNSGNVILVTSAYKDKANIITITWQSPLCQKPALIGISVAESHLSCELIEKSQEFVINIPDLNMLDNVIHCGRVSGRDADKFIQTGLTPIKAERLSKAPKIMECKGSLECYVRDVRIFGDHKLFVGEVIYADAQEDFFSEVWDVDKVKLIYHLGGRYFTGPKSLIKK